jgi:hypothetical protein
MMKRPHRFHIELRPTFGPATSYAIKEGSVILQHGPTVHRTAVPTLSQWSGFWRLCDFIAIWDWLPDYTPLENMRDGQSWTLEIAFDKTKRIIAEGHNGYPSLESVNCVRTTMDRLGFVVALLRADKPREALAAAKLLSRNTSIEVECYLWALLANHEADAAKDLLLEWLPRFPNHLPFHLMIGYLYLDEGHLDSASKEFAFAVNLDPLNAITLCAKAKSHILKDEREEGERLAALANLIDPSSSSGLILASLEPWSEQGKERALFGIGDVLVANHITFRDAGRLKEFSDRMIDATREEFFSMQRELITAPYEPWRKKCWQ